MGTVNSPPAISLENCLQWLSINETSLFLHDGLIRASDLIEVPEESVRNNRSVSGNNTTTNSSSSEQINEVIAFDTKNPKELSDRILSLCGTQNNAYVRLVNYRLNALRGLWIAQRQIAIEQAEKSDINSPTASSSDEVFGGTRKQSALSGLWHHNESPSFTSRLGLLLVLPLLKSQSKCDPTLCLATTKLLLQCLLECAPHSLSREPEDCLNGLEELLCSWLEEINVGKTEDLGTSDTSISGVYRNLEERESVAAALVALSSARGSLRSFINTLHLLHNLPDIKSLPVAHILRKLLELEGGSSWSSLIGNRHAICWGFEDMLPVAAKKDGADKDVEFGRSVTCDGQFLYTTNSAGWGLAKIGTGFKGTLRGCVYTKANDIGPGRVAWGGPGLLLLRPHEFDINKESSRLAVIVNPYTLKLQNTIYIPSSVSAKSVVTTIQFCSDGLYFYWIWCPGSLSDKSIKNQSIFVDTFVIKAGQNEAVPIKRRVMLQRKDEVGTKSFNETLMSLLRPYRPSSATNLVVLSGNHGPPFVPVVQDNSAVLTSCGIALKSLLRVPIYCCGNSIVIVTTSSTTAANNAPARSPFGNVGSLGNLRSLATCYCFNLKDGLFVGRNELYDAPTCSLARGAQLPGMAACYDVSNNLIWMCSNEWIDYFLNPGHQAIHHINRRLKIIDTVLSTSCSSDDRLSLPEVIRQLLQHVGSLCHHQSWPQIVDSFTTAGNSIITHQQQQFSLADTSLFVKVLDMLEMAIRSHDDQIICCNLIILQVICRIFKTNKISLEEGTLKRTRFLLWQLLTSDVYRTTGNDNDGEYSVIQTLACQVFCTAISVLYSSSEDQAWIFNYLLTEGVKVPVLTHLRNLIMSDYAERLKFFNVDASELKQLILNDDLLDQVINHVVEESCSLLQDCFRLETEEFEKLLISLPCASPCVEYLCALQNYIFRHLICAKPTSEHSDLPVTADDKSAFNFSDFLLKILSFAQKILIGARKAFEVLIEICETRGNHRDDQKQRFKALERVVKSTILGYLLPTLFTALSHSNLQHCSTASVLMPYLVRLIILSSRAALSLKKNCQTDNSQLQQENGDDSSSTVTVKTDRCEEMGFLDGLKIPNPWTRGCTVESIHPVRDNYKLKETVHIPGARCLFLRYDPRCSSQYDYDKLLVYAGPDATGIKVAEYGGNTYGYGSRSVLGAGWPKDLVKVEGDTVTFVFEMRSGREHNTPDKAMWGFLIIVRPQESLEALAKGLPFVTDLALGLTVLASDILQLLYKGPALSSEELNAEILLKSRFLQHCVYNVDDEKFLNFSNSTPVAIDENVEVNTAENLNFPISIKMNLSVDYLHKLRQLSGCVSPQLRPSIRSALHADQLEDRIISAILKHANLPTSASALVHFQEIPECQQKMINILCQSFQKLDSLIRRLQALAELEQRWQSEVEDIRQGMMPASMAFFADYHFSDSKTKELSMLCFLKGVDMEGSSAEVVVHNLREKLETEAYNKDACNGAAIISFIKTRQLVATILQRAEILLMVSLEHNDKWKMPSFVLDEEQPDASVASQTKPAYSRSFSAPCPASELLVDKNSSNDLNISQIPKNKRLTGLWGRYSTSILGDIQTDDKYRNYSRNIQPMTLLDQLFSILSCQPEKIISPKDFKSAIENRKLRGISRRQSLVYMKELLTATLGVGGVTHLLAAVTSVIQDGPKTNELTCSGMTAPVREAFAVTIACVVKVASRYPLACSNSIGLLCVIPYAKSEERCLMNSGLVQLLDWMCSLSDHRSNTSSDPKNLRQRVAAMAWAGFQVLSNCCVSWEDDTLDEESLQNIDQKDSEQSGLARQVATLLTNHLARATDNNCNDAAGNEALQEVLSLLNNLSKSKMGKAILSQPTCVSKLLSLLLDQRPSPKLVLVILQLCRSALPLMSAEDCDKVILPTWGSRWGLDNSMTNSNIPSQIASLLLAKLADFVIPGFPVTSVMDNTSQEIKTASKTKDETIADENSTNICVQGKCDENDVLDGRLAVYLYKREDQSVHDVVHPLLSSESRLYRLSGSNVERIERISKELSKSSKAEICTEDAHTALRRAAKWAQMGMIVSTGPALEKDPNEASNDKKKITNDVICKEKNIELVKTDPVRSFISGQVANNMASEVIALLHELLKADTAAKIWNSSVRNVLGEALSCLPQIVKQMDILGSSHSTVMSHLQSARRLLATLCALGGFKTTMKVGSEVLVSGDTGMENCSTCGTIVALTDEHGLATVKLNLNKVGETSHCYEGINYETTCRVPLSRLTPVQFEPLPLEESGLRDQVIHALHLFLMNESERKPFPVVSYGGEENVLPMAISRIVAEIRTRACMVLALYLKNKSFCQKFIRNSPRSMEITKSIALECLPSDRNLTTENHCERLRMLFRDCAKPPLPPIRSNGSKTKEITWNTTKGFPPVRASLFSHGLTGITFLGDPSATVAGLPRGTFLYASQVIPQQAPSFYWELEICSLGEPQDDGTPVVSFGFAPQAERKDAAWTNPVGTVLFHNNGRAVHYNGSSLLQWKSVKLEVTLATGDIAGCGWERTDCLPELLGRPAKGHVFFTHNGQRLTAIIDDVAGGVYPVVHILKKNTRVKANFGVRPFAYAEGLHHVTAAHKALESTEEISAAFGLLPFPGCSDSESDVSEKASSLNDISGEVNSENNQKITKGASLPSPVCKVPIIDEKVVRDYDYSSSSRYILSPSFNSLLYTGPDPHPLTGLVDIEDNVYDDQQQQQQEDHYALLVKAWESRVFPVIRRRFRNEGERKDGLEQIKGALQLGMTDIARQTVEFLYEENGGIPRDLHLPTIEDIKEEMSRITLDRIKKGTDVLIRNLSACSSTNAGVTVLPKYAVSGMLKTFGLLAVVLDIDHQNELIQLEIYLRSEGILVRFWYPLEVLERPPIGMHRMGATAGTQIVDTTSSVVHRELLFWEHALSRIYCRSSFLELSDASKSLTISEEVDRIQFLSDDLLSLSCVNGAVFDRCLTTCRCSRSALKTDSCLISDLFYSDVDIIKNELEKIIGKAISESEEQLVDLTNKITFCLQLDQFDANFRNEQFEINESKIVTDVNIAEAAFLVVSCKVDRAKNIGKSNSAPNVPWARIFSYSGQDFKRNGQVSRQEVVSYPYGISTVSNSPSTGLSLEYPYPTVILSCDRIHLRLGGCSSSDVNVTIHAIPSNFPLAIAFIENILQWQWPLSQKHLAFTVTSKVVDILCNFIGKVDIPARLKECIFHLLAEALRKLLQSEMDLSTIDYPSLALLSLLQMELRRLYEEESKTSVNTSTESSSNRGGIDHSIRFSSYFHCLMEVCLAMAEIASRNASKSFPNSIGVANAGLYGICASAMALSSTVGVSICGPMSSTGAAPPSPSAGSKRKKMKAKRDRDRTSPKLRSGSSSPRSSVCENESQQAGTSAAATTLGAAKAEELLWFHRAITACEMLRIVVDGKRNNSFAIDDAITDAAQVLSINSAHERLLVITGIPKNLEENVIKRAIEKALRSVGGPQRGKIFISNESIKIDPPSFQCHSSSSIPYSEENESDKLAHRFAVVEIKVKAKMETARKALFRCKALLDGGSLELGLMTEEVMDLTDNNISISTVKENLQLSDPDDNYVLEAYLKHRLYGNNSLNELSEEAIGVLTDIFHSCFITDQHLTYRDAKEDSGFICLSREQITNHAQGNLLHAYFSAIQPIKKSITDQISALLQSYGFIKKEDKDSSVTEKLMSPDKQKPKKSALKRTHKEKFVLVCQTDQLRVEDAEKNDSPEGKNRLGKCRKDECGVEEKYYLTLDGFLQYVKDKAQKDIISVWQGILACGYDWHFDRCCCVDVNQAQQMSHQWTLEMDCALVQRIDTLCRKFVISPAQLHPHEIYFSPAEFAAAENVCLQGLSIENLRLRTAFLQSLNTTLECYFLPFVDLRPADSYLLSTAKLLSKARGVVFHDTKITLMNHVLNFTSLRKSDQAAPEIILDPLEVIRSEMQEMPSTQFYQAMKKLEEIPSSQFCVQLASGGDPTYSFNVKLVGEEVHGTSGSFRHFLSQASRELQSSALPLLASCPSAAANRNKGKYILQPGQLNYQEEKMLQFFGQLLGITIRAGIPLPIDLVTAFWKQLVNIPLDPFIDLQDVDLLTHNYIKEFDLVDNAKNLSQLLEEHHNPHFVYTSLNGDKVELCCDGQNVPVSWENHSEYVIAIRNLRMKELSSPDRYLAIKAGLACIVPIHLIHLLTPLDLEIRTCGIAFVDIDFLKVHTMYQVGLTETDPHIRFFWNALESLSQEELRKFIKFACNQDRIPLTCSCKDNQQETVHVPPYPMKIAPPEGRSGTPDSRYIRAETCMFMLKLPQYSTQEIMTERLLYAINCRDDPLSG